MTWALLLSLLVKSSLIAGAGLACSRLLAQRPVDRVDILRGVTCLLLALPVIRLDLTRSESRRAQVTTRAPRIRR